MKLHIKVQIVLFVITILIINVIDLTAQNVVHPTVIKKPVGFAISGPLRNNPVVSYSDFKVKEIPINRKINPNIQPPNFSKMLLDPGKQTQFGLITGNVIKNYPGQNTNFYPPDANGDVGNLYYFQTVNTTYTIYRKSDGGIMAGPSALNTIFDPSLPGAQYNDGDPVILWDEHADRWLFLELSISGTNDYMLIAVSTTNDPTGTWYSWSFDVTDTPDYPKIGIWQDGYYMATNTPSGNDVYVFDRTAMVAGNSNPTMIGFDNPNRPSTFDGFHSILPLDNDGAWAPTGAPGQFITIADDGQENPNDALYIYELHADWTTPSNSTFTRTQIINVNPFSGNFNSSWNNIPQPGTTQKLDALSTILMHRAQYRNFNGTQKIVCTHTIAELSTEAAIRWYELENTGSGWSIAQQGTYNPDNVSRWSASIAMNDIGEIAMAYSVSDGSSTYPGIRFTGQSNSAQPGIMDIAETTIWTGSYSQLPVPNYSYGNRWGDYANISIDPSDGKTFWFTTEYKESTTDTKGTRIAAISSFSSNVTVIVDQKLSTGSSIGTLRKWDWNNIQFGTPFNPGTQFDFGLSSTQVILGDRNIISNEKYNNWNGENDVRNHHVFLINSTTKKLTSQFNPTNSGITIENNFPETPTLGSLNSSIQFQDPWLIDYPDSLYGNNVRNQGMSAPFKTRTSPFNPDYTTSFNGDIYKGVFLNQNTNFLPDLPNYSINVQSPQDINLGGVLGTHKFYFQNWSGTGVTFQNPNSAQTAVVFNSSNAVAEANLKGTQLSNNLNAFSNSSQRKFVRTDDGNLHLVYESMGKAWYEISTNNGLTWQIANGGLPLSGSNEGKLPAIDYEKGSNTIVIVWQEKDGGAYDIKSANFSSAGNYWYGATIFMDIYLPYSSNTNPVVSWDGEGRILVMWKRDQDNVGNWPTGIVFSYGTLTVSGWNEMDFGLIPNTNSNSTNPTLATNKTYSIPSTYHLAWEQTAGSYSYIKYFELYRDGYQKIQTTTSSPETPSSGAGFWTNRKPSITALDDNTPRLVWVGYAPWYGSRAVFRAKQTNGSWSSTIYNYSVYGNVESVNINRTDDGNYALSFSDVYNGSQLEYVKSSNLGQISSFGTTGKDVQVGNAVNFNNMYAIAFQTNATPYKFVQTSFNNMSALAFQSNVTPYKFVQTSNVDSLQKQPPKKISNGRAAAVIKDGVEFIYAMGDVTLDDEKIDFVDIDSSNQIKSLQDLSRNLVTEPFLLENNSKLTLSVLSAVTDSAAAEKLLKGDKYVRFEVELIEAASGANLGSFVKLEYGVNNIEGQNILSYTINTKEVVQKEVQLKLSITENISGKYALSRFIGEDSVLPLGKEGYQEASYNVNLTVTEYALAQNYPNPFNPSTTINYQLPKAGVVTLKIYNVLGREVKTLVSEFQAKGRYSMNFNAGELASGVYIYRLKVNDFSSAKKLLLLK